MDESIKQLDELQEIVTQQLFDALGIPKALLEYKEVKPENKSAICVLNHLHTKLTEAITNHNNTINGLDKSDKEGYFLHQGHILALDGFRGYVEYLIEEIRRQ